MIYCQLNNASIKEEREVKMSAVTLLDEKYDIAIDLFAKIGYNCEAGGGGHNLGSWKNSREKIESKSAHNTDGPSTSTYQPRGTVIIIRGRMTQYTKHREQDILKSGW